MYEVTGADLEYASYLANTINRIDADSRNKLILIEKHDLIAFLGELTFEKILLENDIDYIKYDIFERPVHGSYDYLVNNFRIDVKTEKLSFGEPDREWICHVRDYQLRNYLTDPIDFLVFTVVNLRELKSWILGYISLDKFLEVAKPVSKGEPVNGRYTCKEDMWIIKARNLNPIDKLLKLIKK